MHCFYIDKGQIEEETIRIIGDDVNHIKNVLRMEIGDTVSLCDKEGIFYTCEIESLNNREIRAKIRDKNAAETELPVKIYLFQGIPKKDKMELIIQKAVELGVFEIIPVACKFCVAKIEDKKKEKNKRGRWQLISEAAAKQSGRGIIPNVHEVMTFKEALTWAKDLEGSIIPYELSEGMQRSKEVLKQVCRGSSIGVFIGPEGGFAKEEAALAQEFSVLPVSLGKRILRTETAGLTTLSLLMFEIESAREECNSSIEFRR